MRNVQKWLASTEDHSSNEVGEVKIQDGNTPKEDPDAGGRAADDFDVDVAKPATAEIPAASEGASEGTDKHHDTVDVHVSSESEGTTAEPGGQNGHDDDDTQANGGESSSSNDDGGQTDAGDTSNNDEFEDDGQQGPDHDKTGAAEADAAEEGGERTTAEIEPTGDGEPSTGSDPSDSHVGGNAQGTKTENVSSEEHDGDDPQDNVPMVEPQNEEDDEEELDLDGQTSTAEATAQQVGEVTNDIEEMTNKQEAMEAYYGRLRESLTDGGLTRNEADFVRMGLEQIHPGFGGEAVVASTESFGLIASRVDATQVSLEGLKENIQKVGEAIKRAIKWMMDLMKDLYHKAAGGMSRNRKRLEKLKTRLGQVQSNQLNDKVTIRGSQKLVVNGEFAGNDPRAVDNIQQSMTYLFKKYPKDAVSLMKEMEDLRKNIDSIKDPSHFQRVLPTLAQKAFSAVPGNRDMAGKDVGGVVAKVPKVGMGVLLPGNKALVRYNPSTMKDYDGGDVTKLIEGFRMSARVRFVDVSTARASNQSEVSYSLPSKQALVGMYEKLDALAKTAEDQFAEAQGTFKDIEKTLQMDGPSAPAGDPKIQQRQIAVMNYMKRLPGDFVAPLSDFMGYLSSAINAYTSVLEHNIRQYEAAEKQQSGQSTNALPAPS